MRRPVAPMLVLGQRPAPRRACVRGRRRAARHQRPAKVAQGGVLALQVDPHGAKRCSLSVARRGKRAVTQRLRGGEAYVAELQIAKRAVRTRWTVRVRCDGAASNALRVRVSGRRGARGNRLVTSVTISVLDRALPPVPADPAESLITDEQGMVFGSSATQDGEPGRPRARRRRVSQRADRRHRALRARARPHHARGRSITGSASSPSTTGSRPPPAARSARRQLPLQLRGPGRPPGQPRRGRQGRHHPAPQPRQRARLLQRDAHRGRARPRGGSESFDVVDANSKWDGLVRRHDYNPYQSARRYGLVVTIWRMGEVSAPAAPAPATPARPRPRRRAPGPSSRARAASTRSRTPTTRPARARGSRPTSGSTSSARCTRRRSPRPTRTATGTGSPARRGRQLLLAGQHVLERRRSGDACPTPTTRTSTCPTAEGVYLRVHRRSPYPHRSVVVVDECPSPSSSAPRPWPRGDAALGRAGGTTLVRAGHRRRFERPGRGRAQRPADQRPRRRDRLQRPGLVPRLPAAARASTAPRPRSGPGAVNFDSTFGSFAAADRIIYAGSDGERRVNVAIAPGPGSEWRVQKRGPSTGGARVATAAAPKHTVAAFSTFGAGDIGSVYVVRQSGVGAPGATERISGKGHIRSVSVAVNASGDVLAAWDRNGTIESRLYYFQLQALGPLSPRSARSPPPCTSASRSAPTTARSSRGSTSAVSEGNTGQAATVWATARSGSPRLPPAGQAAGETLRTQTIPGGSGDQGGLHERRPRDHRLERPQRGARGAGQRPLDPRARTSGPPRLIESQADPGLYGLAVSPDGPGGS